MLVRLDDLDEEFKHEGIELDLMILLYINISESVIVRWGKRCM